MNASIGSSRGIFASLLLWSAWLILVLAAVLALAPNKLLHFLLDLIVSYREIVMGLAIAAAMLHGAIFLGDGRRRLVGTLPVIVAIVLCGYLGWRDWLSYAREDFAFNADNATLRGTLYLPNAPGPFAAVVIAHGSPDIPRRLYDVWADALVREGFAVLAFDKRGSGLSGGSYDRENNGSAESLERLGLDLAAAVNALAQHPQIDAAKISFLGLSQAGWTVPIALAHTTNVHGFVLLSGPTSTGREEGAFSASTGEAAGPNWSAKKAAADQRVRDAGPGGFDPLPFLRSGRVRGHYVFGGMDSSIPVRRSIEILDALISEGHPYSYEVLEGDDHLLIDWRSGLPDFDDRVWSILRRELKK